MCGGSDPWTKHCFESVKDDEDGAILIFVTGLAEITATVEKLRASEVLEGRATIHALHSQLSTSDQQAIFRRAPKGTRKIVVSTNIAETSITIDDVVYVVDAARVKENRYDADRGDVGRRCCVAGGGAAAAAGPRWGGEAGRRVPPGDAAGARRRVRRLSSARDPANFIGGSGAPDLVLTLGDPKKFLRGAVSPPTAQAVDRALELLAQIDALEPMDSEGAPKVAALNRFRISSGSFTGRAARRQTLVVGAMLGGDRSRFDISSGHDLAAIDICRSI